MNLTIYETLSYGETFLQNAEVEDYKIDAELLLSFVTGFDKQKLFLNRTDKLDDKTGKKYFVLLDRRAAGEPLQYITGEQFFMGHRFIVNPSVLIPRPETERIAELAIGYLNNNKDALNVLDLCTGSGAIAISIAKACPDIKLTATDISPDALKVARQNATELGVNDRIKFFKSDLFDNFKDGGLSVLFDLVVTNPPYIRTCDIGRLTREIREHEPILALDGGADGLAFYRRIAADAGFYQKKGGMIIAEMGYDPKDASQNEILTIFKDAGYTDIKTFRDLCNRDRILTAFTGI